MLLKLSNYLIVVFLAATVCSLAANIVPRDENGDSNIDRKAGNVGICIQGQNDALLCWNRRIENHIFVGNTTACTGTHISSEIMRASASGIITNLQVTNLNPLTGLLAMQWNYGGGLCTKTVWNDIQNYPQQGFPVYTHAEIMNICVNTINNATCMTPPLGLVADSGHLVRICVKVVIRNPPNPGITCYPRGINGQAGNIGMRC